MRTLPDGPIGRAGTAVGTKTADLPLKRGLALVTPKPTMKKTLIALVVAAASPAAFAQTTVTTTTIGTGTITEYAPGSALVVKESSGPVTYRYSDSVTYVTKKGRVLTADEVRARMRVGAPVSVTYATEGSDRVVNRIEVDDDGEIEIERD